MNIRRTRPLRILTMPFLIMTCDSAHTASSTPPASYAYAPNIHDSSISLFEIDAAGRLHLRSTLPIGMAPRDMDTFGKTVYMVDIGADTLTTFTLDNASDTLRQHGTPLPTGQNPESIIVDPLGRFVYVTNGSSNNIGGYRIGNKPGELTEIGRYASSDYPTDIAMDPCGRWLYVTNYAAHSVSSYAVDPHSGALEALGSIATGNSPAAAAVAPSSEFLYVADGLGSSLSVYRIHPDHGTLSFIARVDAGEYPYAVTVDQAGRYLYTANFGSNDVTSYAIRSDGIPVKIDSVPAAIGPFSFTLDRSGRHAYVANVRSGSLNVYTVHPERGTLTPLETVQGRPGSATIALSTARRHTCPQ